MCTVYGRSPTSLFVSDYTFFLKPFVEETIISPFCVLSTLLNDQLTVFASAYFGVFCLVSVWSPALPTTFADRWLIYIYLKSSLVKIIINVLLHHYDMQLSANLAFSLSSDTKVWHYYLYQHHLNINVIISLK